MKKAVLLVSHGSYSPKAKEEAALLASSLKAETDVAIFEISFLEIEMPDIPGGIDICIQKGATEILILLNFLNSGRHAIKDIPSIVKEAQNKYPHIRFSISKPIGQHPGIKNLFIDLINST